MPRSETTINQYFSPRTVVVLLLSEAATAYCWEAPALSKMRHMGPSTVKFRNCMEVVDNSKQLMHKSVKVFCDQFPHIKDLSHRDILNDCSVPLRVVMY